MLTRTQPRLAPGRRAPTGDDPKRDSVLTLCSGTTKAVIMEQERGCRVGRRTRDQRVLPLLFPEAADSEHANSWSQIARPVEGLDTAGPVVKDLVPKLTRTQPGLAPGRRAPTSDDPKGDSVLTLCLGTTKEVIMEQESWCRVGRRTRDQRVLPLLFPKAADSEHANS